MYILAYERISQDIIDSCGNIGIANLLNITKTIVNLIQIIGPILAMVSLAVCFIKLMTNPEEKKYKASLKNSLMALVILFLVPFLVNLTMSLADESFDLAKCWNNAEQIVQSGNHTYVDISDDPKQSIVNTSDDSNQSTTTTSATNLIFVGDSRTVGMHSAVGGNDIWSGEKSAGLDWMKSSGVPNIEANIGNGSAVIILMGVNDLYQPANYISYINEKASVWSSKGARTYFVSVNPTEGSYSTLNRDIDSFNQQLKKGLSNVSYIDTNSYLKSNGYSTQDGLHYTNDTYNKIYNYIKSHL